MTILKTHRATSLRWLIGFVVALSGMMSVACGQTLTAGPGLSKQRLAPTPLITDFRTGYQQVLSLHESGTPPPPPGIEASARVWFVIELVNPAPQNQHFMLNSPLVKPYATTFYLLNSQRRLIDVINYAPGDYELSEYAVPGPTLPVTVPAGQTVTVLLSVKQARPHYPLIAYSQAAFHQHLVSSLILYCSLAGALAVLAAYFYLSYFYQKTAARFWLATACLLCLATGAYVFEPVGRMLNFIEYGKGLLTATGFLLLFSLIKYNHNLFSRIPGWLKALNMLFPLVLPLLAYLPVPDIMPQTWHLSVPLLAVLQVLLIMVYRDRRNPSLYRVIAVGWLLLTLAWLEFVVVGTPEIVAYEGSTHSAVLALILGICALALGILLAERGENRQQITNHQRKIEDLNIFYHLFRNSAEGLYTCNMSGELKSINPAMCTLFGYPDETTMLSRISNTAEFYADPTDRDLLIGELLENKSVMGREIKGRKADGSEIWLSISCQLHREEDGDYLSGSIFDITDRKLSDLSLTYMATHDALTGVLNRREFENALHKALANSHEKDDVILLYLDLDRFKAVNDTCGHKAGDKLIQELATLLENTLDNRGILARLGGDEFAALITRQTPETAYLISLKLLDAVRSYRFLWDNRIFTVGVSIGFLNASETNADAEQSLTMADAACYLAKQQGRNQVYCYQRNDIRLKQYEQELDWITLLNDALKNDGFELYFQPYQALIDVPEGHYFEVFLRLPMKDGSLATPQDFIPSAERYSLTSRIDRWVIENVFSWLHSQPDIFAQLQCCNINLHGHSVTSTDVRRAILAAFERYQIPHDKIAFDISETTAIVQQEDTLTFVNTFAELGCKFALDDFGSGFSSYSYLKSLPVHCVKIDGRFIQDILSDQVDIAIVRSISEIAHARQMRTVAECVEDKAMLSQLGKIGIDFAQGNAIGKAQPLSQFTELCDKNS